MLIGRLGQDPEKRVTQTGQSVATLSLATSETYKDKSGNKQEKTEWHKVVFWNQQAELIEQYCKKGSQLYIEGTLQTREWQDKDGNKRWTTEVVSRRMQFLDSRPQNTGGGYGQSNDSYQGQGQNQPFPQQPPTSNDQGMAPPNRPAGNDDFIEDDIPF